MKLKTMVNVVNERIIIMNDMYSRKIVNEDEKRIRIYLRKGLVGYISKCNRHALSTKYIPVDFKTYFYHDPFTAVYIDRHYLNGVNPPSRQAIPDEFMQVQYAYALPVNLARLSHWDDGIVIADKADTSDEFERRMLYNAITRYKKSVNFCYGFFVDIYI